MPAATAIPVPDPDVPWVGRRFGADADADVGADANVGADAVTINVAVSVLLGDVEPDVRLKMTCPASTENGAVLPLVAVRHVLLDWLPGLQQNSH